MKKLALLVLACLLVLTGCFGGNGAEDANNEGDTAKVEQQKDDTPFQGGTVKELKQKFGSSQDKAIMPLYNVKQDEIFTFRFQTNLSSLTPTGYVDEDQKIISVHTDIKALDASKISALVALEETEDGKTVARVEPINGVLALDSNPKGLDWGSAPIYYIKINYDMDATEPTELETPIIIPFTIKTEVATPTLHHEILSDGRLKLVWNAVEGADSYNIYQIEKPDDLENFTNTPISAAETGYDSLYPFIQATVKDTSFMDWTNDGDNGLGYFGDKQIIYEQNVLVSGDYFITAVKDGKESLASNYVSSAKLGGQLPSQLVDDSFKLVDNVDQLPKKTKVKMIDGSEKDYNVIYHTDGIVPDMFDDAVIPYNIQGTALKGDATISNITKDELAALGGADQENTTSARMDPENETDYVPAPDVPTIIDTGSQAPSETSDSLVEDQKSNTEKIVEEANNDELPAVPEDVPINADTAFETYLAINLLAGNEAISLRAFPEAQNFETITDTLLEVMYQNPLIIGIDAWGYDYKKLTLGVRYNDNPEEIKKQQEEIVNEASKIVADIIKEGMSDEEKREAIYHYLADNTKYDDAALKAAEANDFQGDLDEQFDDSFTTYGIMVKKVGVCMSYAYSYKLLSDLAGLESIVVTGDANGVPHAWNKVKIGDEWLHVDVTNNDSDSSLGFRLLYNSNDDSAVAVNSIVSDEYWVNTEIEQFYGKDNSNDYYVVNKLEASTLDDYKKILVGKLAAGDSIVVIRYTGDYDEDAFYSAIGSALQESAPDKLETAQFAAMGNYMVVFADSAE